MGIGPLVILASPWLVLSFPPMHRLIYEESPWNFFAPNYQERHLALGDDTAVVWSLVIIGIGAAMLFTGLGIRHSLHSHSSRRFA